MALTQPPMAAVNPSQARAGIDATNQSMGRGSNPEALMSRLNQLAQEAEMIMGKLESMGVNVNELMAGGGQNAQPPAPVPPMPQMPVEGVTGGGMPPGLLA